MQQEHLDNRFQGMGQGLVELPKGSTEILIISYGIQRSHIDTVRIPEDAADVLITKYPVIDSIPGIVTEPPKGDFPRDHNHRPIELLLQHIALGAPGTFVVQCTEVGIADIFNIANEKRDPGFLIPNIFLQAGSRLKIARSLMAPETAMGFFRLGTYPATAGSLTESIQGRR